MPFRAFLFLLLYSITGYTAVAQSIRGEVLEDDTRLPITDVSIQNIHTSLIITTDDKGTFVIAASGGQLLEFRKDGYKTARARIPSGYIPSFFRIVMKKGFSDIKKTDLAQSNRYNYHDDSVRYHDLYKHELDFPRMSGIDMIASPFTALSRHNQEIWRFQENYEQFEKEKYVDKTFNDAVITRYTGLTGDSLHSFMRRFRPSYEQLKGMNDYTFFTFIKNSAYHYRNAARPSNSR